MNKRVSRVLIYTLLVFSLFAFAVYPKSHAKYIKEDESLFYGFKLNNLFVGESKTMGIQRTSTYQKVNYVFRFNRSTYLGIDDTSVKYRIVVNNVCDITRIDTKGTSSFNNNIGNLSYSNNNEDEIVVYYTCNVDDVVKNMNSVDALFTEFKVYETYMPDNIEYLYTRGSHAEKLDDYYNLYPLPSGIISSDKKTLLLPALAENKYGVFTSWLTQYATLYGEEYLNDIRAYIELVYNEEEDILNTSLQLKGLSVTSTNGDYTYVIDDMLIGLARTHNSLLNNNIYFSDFKMSDIQMNELFVYYLNTYVYPGDSTTINTVLEHVNSRGGIKKLINGEITIPGLTYFKDKQYIKISDNILNIIAASKSSPAYALYGEMFDMLDSISSGLISNYSFITNEIIDYIYFSDDCLEFGSYWYITNTAFNKYYVITPVIDTVEQTPILFHIYSNYIESDSTTHVNYVTATQLISGMEIVLESNNKDELRNTINSIHTVLGVTKNINENMFTTSGTYNNYFTSVVTGNNIKITFVLE